MDTKELPEELRAFIEQEVASGKYQSEADVICASLHVLKARGVETNGDALSHPNAGALDPKLTALKQFVDELAAFPVENPSDGFSVRDHDKLLYGDP